MPAKTKGTLFTALFITVPVLLGLSPNQNSARSLREVEENRSATPPISAGIRLAPPPAALNPRPPRLRSAYALVEDPAWGTTLYAKGADRMTPIASITKLMTAMVVLDAHLDMSRPITITREDVDTLRHSASRLPVGWTLSRWDLLQLALMASENRAAFALARTYPGGRSAFVSAMNDKACFLGMADTRFADPTGLDGGNVSTARDLARLARTAARYETVRRMTTTPRVRVQALKPRRTRIFGNSNRLVFNGRWQIGLSKTGYISEAGYCLVMEARMAGRPLLCVFLDSQGKYSRLGDAVRIRRWLEGRSGSRGRTRRR